MDRSLESRRHLPTAAAASKHATAPPHTAGEMLENASAPLPMLVPITAEEVQHALDRFPAEPLSPQPDRSLESSPHLPTAGAASKHATALPHAAGEMLENASARPPVLISLTAEELQHALDRFPAEPLSPQRDRSSESSPHLPTAEAASKHATALPHTAGEMLENASARLPVLIPITAEEVQHALDRFPAEPLSPPEIDDGILAGFAVEHVSLSADDGDDVDDNPRTRLTSFAPLVAAALTALVLMGVTVSVRLMRSGTASPIATSNVQPTELAMPAIQTVAPTVDTPPSNPTTTQNGAPISTDVPKERTREIVAPTVEQSFAPRERPTPQGVPSSIFPESPAALSPSERPVPPVSVAGSFPLPVPILEAIGTASVETLPTTVSVEAKPIVPEPVTPAGTEAAKPASRTSASETGAIQDVLGRYRTAFNELDAGAASAIWPGLDTKALRRAFEQIEQQNLVFDKCQIAVTDASAVASCGGAASYVQRVGKKTRRDDRRHWEFNLRKIDDVWLIDTVSVR